MPRRILPLALCVFCAVCALSCKAEKKEPALTAADAAPRLDEFTPGVAYTNYRYADVPWSVCVVRVNRADPGLKVLSAHARGGVGGTTILSDIIRAARARGEPLAAVNGDFYARDRSAYSGDPRGLQIVEGDLISAPIGGVAFWIDRQGEFHTTNIMAQFNVTWPDGTSSSFDLNQARRSKPVLYTPSMGPSTFTSTGRELVLEHGGKGPWLPLKVGAQFTAKVREVRETGHTPLTAEIMVLSLDPLRSRNLPAVKPGDVLTFSTATSPDLAGAQQAISGGPVLVANGEVQRVKLPDRSGPLPYEFRSMRERHPRAAIGWNSKHFYLIQVDGRQRLHSIGMTLEELGEFAVKRLDCTFAMNLDGGVSATLWAGGRVRNSPADGGRERDIANAVIVVREGARARANATGNNEVTPTAAN